MNSGSVKLRQPTRLIVRRVKPSTIEYVVEVAGCSGSSDTLACLRTVPYTTFLNAANSVPGIFSYFTVNLSYLPRPDRKSLTASPDILIKTGKYAKVPFIVGDQEDEGTFFGLFTPSLTTTKEIPTYLSTIFFNNASPARIDELVNTYQTTTKYGSPFRTDLLNNFYPQFKRVSAILGDLTFTLTRRFFLETASQVNPGVLSWSYLATYDYGTPFLGTYHGSDILQVFNGVLPNNAAKTFRGYYYSFIYDLDPNKGNGLMEWPHWSAGKKLVNFGRNANSYINDSFREDTYTLLKDNVEILRV